MSQRIAQLQSRSCQQLRKKIPLKLYRFLLVETRGICSVCHENRIHEIHHIRHVAHGGSNEYENLLPVCSNCHVEIHRTRVPISELRRLKRDWVADNRRILAKIISASPDIDVFMRRLHENYFQVAQEGEMRLFRDRLKKIGQLDEVFHNFAWIKRHTISRKVEADGSCWSEEHLSFSPIKSQSYRVIYLRGDQPVDFEALRFSAEFKLNGKALGIESSLERDEPSFKAVKLDWRKRTKPSDRCELGFRYFWPKTWEMGGDAYSYDVLSWIDEVVYDFELPARYRFNRVTGSILDVFGREWPRFGKATRKLNRFTWSGRRIPLFTSANIGFETRVQ